MESFKAADWFYKKIAYPALTLGAENRLVAHERFTRFAQVLENSPPAIIKSFRNQLLYVDPKLNISLFGKWLPHPYMVAAGVDKNAKALATYYSSGAAGHDVGTIVLDKYPGHPDGVYAHALVEDLSFINRISYKSDGSSFIKPRLVKFISRYSLQDYLLTTNIGATQKAFENGYALYDVCKTISRLKQVGDADFINIGSPNTDAHQDLNIPKNLDNFLSKTTFYKEIFNIHKPLGLKLAIDVPESIFKEQIDVLIKHKIPALVIANTSTNPQIIESTSKYKDKPGGRSGACITELGNNLSQLGYEYLKSRGEEDKMVIIRSGGVVFPRDGWDAISFGGARGIQLCSALFLPQTASFSIFKDYAKDLSKAMGYAGINNLDELRGSKTSYPFS